MKVFAIIVTYNSERWIRWCLQSLRNSTHPITPIIVDNHSSDSTLAIIQQSYPEAIVIPQTDNLGFGQANNIGIRYALEQQAEAVLLLNSDAAVSPEAVEKLVRQCDGSALLSPLHLNGQGKQLDHLFKVNTICDSDNHLIDHLITHHPLQPHYPITSEVCAACWFIPRQILQRIGGFNPLFFHYGEDNNYQHRLRFHQLPTLLVPTAIIYHDRERHGNAAMFHKRLIDRELLLIFTNINLQAPAILRRTVATFAKYFRHPLSFCGSFFRILMLLRKIIKSRHAEKIDNTPHWL